MSDADLTEPTYVFHRVEDRQELERLRGLEHHHDPGSRRRLLAVGLRPGWRCLEVGPGAGSILSWLADVVGPSGSVCAVDLSTKFLPARWPPHVELRQADIRTTALPDVSFDLVHARFVLIHLPDYEAVLARLLLCLKPGGWLVLEEPDFSASRGVTGGGAQLEAVRKLNQAIHVMYERLGMDDAVGLRLPALLQRSGLTDLIVENEAPLSAGGSAMAAIMRMSAGQLRHKYVATGSVTDSDVDTYCRFAEDPRTWAVYYATVAVSARRS